jgi:uncharacterized lipoprotein YddW (UPF0748 family)
MRAVDAVIAALQATFSLPTLIDGGNPFLFVAGDPANSKVWICDVESKIDFDRGGSRALITVDRLDYVPGNLHLYNYSQGNFSDQSELSDLGATTIIISCEGGNKYQSEQLGSIVYQIIKLFRRELMREFQLHSIVPLSVSRPSNIEQAIGGPWITNVTVKVETQERVKITEIANHLNALNIKSVFQGNLAAIQQVTLDGG